MLMQSDDMNIVLFGYLNSMWKVILIDAKLALGSSSNNMVACSCAYLRINPNKHVLSS